MSKRSVNIVNKKKTHFLSTVFSIQLYFFNTNTTRIKALCFNQQPQNETLSNNKNDWFSLPKENWLEHEKIGVQNVFSWMKLTSSQISWLQTHSLTIKQVSNLNCTKKSKSGMKQKQKIRKNYYRSEKKLENHISSIREFSWRIDRILGTNYTTTTKKN